MRIKKADTIKVIAGKDKGKTGKVLQVLPSLGRLSVEGVNILSKHLRASEKGKQGQKIEFPSPIQISNVMLVCPQCSKPASVGYKLGQGQAKKSRICKKCKAEI